MVEGDSEGLQGVIPEEMTNEESLELEQERIAGEEARGKETAEEKRTPKKTHSEAFADLNKLLKKV